MPKVDSIIKADTKYPIVFHSPGLEPWILGLLLEFRPYTILDVGCGYGFWGLITKGRLSYSKYVVGLDLNCKKVSKAKIVYDDVVVADARLPPFRERSFDTILAIEVLHILKKDEEIINTFEVYKGISKRLLIATLPYSNHKVCKLLRELSFEIYRYILRGFVLVNRKGVCTMYNTRFCKVLGLLLRVLVKIFPRITDKGYILAIWYCK